MLWQTLETFAFGDSPQLADELAELVLAGRKIATCWAASEGLLTEIGKRMVMLDGAGRPRAVLETVELEQRGFFEVDASFAHDEGEGDRTLASWRRAHELYFSRLGQFTPDMQLWCERFRVVEIITPTSTWPAAPRLGVVGDGTCEAPDHFCEDCSAPAVARAVES